MAADAVGELVGVSDHGDGVPADEGAEASFDELITGEPRLLIWRDGVDVGRRDGRWKVDAEFACPKHQPPEEVGAAVSSVSLDDGCVRLQPLVCLDGIDVGKLF